MKRKSTRHLVYTAVLTAFGILIPVIMPLKLVIGPASFTLASHVPIFIAMLISPQVAFLVAIGTTFGFLIAGFPIVIVFRALSHLLFVLVGAIWVKYQPKLIATQKGRFLLAISINILHGLAEFAVVYLITVSSMVNLSYIAYLFLLIGIGSILHGLLDFYLAYFLVTLLQNRMGITLLSTKNN